MCQRWSRQTPSHNAVASASFGSLQWNRILTKLLVCCPSWSLMMIPTTGYINFESICSLWNLSLNMAFLLYHSWNFRPNQIALLFCLITVGGSRISYNDSIQHVRKTIEPSTEIFAPGGARYYFKNPNSPYKHEEISSYLSLILISKNHQSLSTSMSHILLLGNNQCSS